MTCLDRDGSFVGGYHAYKDVWWPVEGEVLIRLAFAVMKDNVVVGQKFFFQGTDYS